MKITKSSEEVNRNEIRKKIANKGCDKCPECGHKNFSLLCKTYCKGLFKFKNMRIDCYVCSHCGCEYESDEYEW